MIYTIFNVNNIEKLHRNHLLVLLYKHKHLIRKQAHHIGTRLNEKTNVNTPTCKKLFGMMSPLNTSIKYILLRSKNINIDSFQTTYY